MNPHKTAGNPLCSVTFLSKRIGTAEEDVLILCDSNAAVHLLLHFFSLLFSSPCSFNFPNLNVIQGAPNCVQ